MGRRKRKSQTDDQAGLTLTTDDPEFQRVVRHFLTTKPEPHKPLGDNSQSRRRARERSEKK